jgi:hypothetical protein
MSNPQDKYYFLFGETVSKEYYSDDFDKIIKLIETGDYDWHIYCYDESCDGPSDLLSEGDGWGGFAQITEEEYNQLLKLKTDENKNESPDKLD